MISDKQLFIYPLVIEHSHGIDGPATNLHLWLGFSMAMLNYQMVIGLNSHK